MFPYHGVACKNMHTRYTVCDVLDAGNVLRGPMEDVCARLRRLRDGEVIAKEYVGFRNGDGYNMCSCCFMKYVYDRLPENIKAIGNTLDRIQYVEVICKREDLQEERSCQRFVKQTTEGLLEWAYVVDPCEDVEGKDCIVKMIFTTQSGKKPIMRLYERNFPQGSIIRNDIHTTMYNVQALLGREDIVKQGAWSLA